MLICPNVDGKLKPVSFKGVKVSECPVCNGLFFTQHELNQAKNNTDEDLRWLNFNLFEVKGKKYKSKPTSKICPIDHIKMDALKYQHSGVILNKCNICKEIWLDQSEFQKIIKYLEKIIITKSAKGYEKEALKKLLEIGGAHEDKISEIKDLLVVTKLLEERFIVEHPSLKEAIRAIIISTPTGL